MFHANRFCYFYSIKQAQHSINSRTKNDGELDRRACEIQISKFYCNHSDCTVCNDKTHSNRFFVLDLFFLYIYTLNNSRISSLRRRSVRSITRSSMASKDSVNNAKIKGAAVWQTVAKVYNEFSAHSTIHGIKYTTQAKTPFGRYFFHLRYRHYNSGL